MHAHAGVIHTHLRTYIHAYIHATTQVHLRCGLLSNSLLTEHNTCISTYIRARMHNYVHTRMPAQVHTCTHAQKQLCARIFVHPLRIIYTYILHIHAHKYIRTPIHNHCMLGHRHNFACTRVWKCGTKIALFIQILNKHTRMYDSTFFCGIVLCLYVCFVLFFLFLVVV
jgi:hypothetical protein